MTVKSPSKPLALPDQFKDALALVARALGIKKIENKAEYEQADSAYKELIQKEKLLDIQYNELECVIEAKKAQAQKKDLAAQLDAAKKYIKNSPMKAYDDEQERIIREKEEKLRKEAQAKADAEAAALAKIEAAKKAKADKEAADLAAKAKKTRDADEKKRLQEQADEAKKRAADAAAEQARIKADAAAAPVPAVVLERTHQGVSRRQIFKYRLTAKDGRKFLKGEIKASDRLKIGDLGPLPAHLFVLDPVLLNEFVDSQGVSCAIPGVLEVKSEMV